MRVQILYVLLRRLNELRPLAPPHTHRAAANAAVAIVQNPRSSCNSAWLYAAGQLNLDEHEQAAVLKLAKESLQR